MLIINLQIEKPMENKSVYTYVKYVSLNNKIVGDIQIKYMKYIYVTYI